MKIVDQKDTDGNLIGLNGPIDVVQLGNTLRCKETGMCWTVKDEYGDWVSSSMHEIGVKSVMVVESDTADQRQEPES